MGGVPVAALRNASTSSQGSDNVFTSEKPVKSSTASSQATQNKNKSALSQGMKPPVVPGAENDAENAREDVSVEPNNKASVNSHNSNSNDASAFAVLNEKIDNLYKFVNEKFSKLEDVINTMANLAAENEMLRKKVDQLCTDNASDNAQRDNRILSLEKQVSRLVSVAEGKAQQELSMALEIQKVPDSLIKESHTDMVIDCVKGALDIELHAEEILNAKLIKTGQQKSENMLVFNMRDRAAKERVIAARRKMNKRNNFRGIFLRDPSDRAVRVYINERLTQHNRELLREAKKKRMALKFKHLWVSDGKVMMRKEDGGRVIYITDFSDFSKLESVT